MKSLCDQPETGGGQEIATSMLTIATISSSTTSCTSLTNDGTSITKASSDEETSSALASFSHSSSSSSTAPPEPTAQELPELEDWHKYARPLKRQTPHNATIVLDNNITVISNSLFIQSKNFLHIRSLCEAEVLEK
ncbi:unnamed protein product [Gongylonema pulchrum]|uniref:Uncharacterized protein n=1 Tax=Gongylonema pulchrum TaxID=637853 RepID=A0A183D445_9BILA|nr:unnamed protein product [Gongylonema pulchrum]